MSTLKEAAERLRRMYAGADYIDVYGSGSLGIGKMMQDESLVARAYLADLADAMRFVPRPETMSGYGDPDAPDDVKELLEIAARLHGQKLPEHHQ